MDDKTIARFWSKVDRNGPVHPYDPWLGNCWLWTGGKHENGYGRLKISNTYKAAHRLSWLIRHGELPRWCSAICHSCDRPACVSPFHLFAGTAVVNTADKIAKGRHQRAKPLTLDPSARPRSIFGSKNHLAKLSDNDVVEMRRIHASGTVTYRELGKLFGVAPTNARAVCLRLMRKWG